MVFECDKRNLKQSRKGLNDLKAPKNIKNTIVKSCCDGVWMWQRELMPFYMQLYCSIRSKTHWSDTTPLPPTPPPPHTHKHTLTQVQHVLALLLNTQPQVRHLFFNQKVLIFFLFFHKNICCGYSLEVPHWGASNEYPQHMFLWRSKKNNIWITPLIWSYVNTKCQAKEQLIPILES